MLCCVAYFCDDPFHLLQELRELTKLDDVRCLVRKDELEMGRTTASYDELKGNRPKTRIDALLTKVTFTTTSEVCIVYTWYLVVYSVQCIV